MILVVPHMRDQSGRTIPTAAVSRVRIYISNLGKSPVAGHDHVGLFVPDHELYSLTIDRTELVNRTVDRRSMTYLDASGAEASQDRARYVKFTSLSGIADKIDYIEHADYIDLSDITIETEPLPNGRYIMCYEATYQLRTISDGGELLCIGDKEVTAKFRFLLNHPGEVLLMMVDGTPDLYFTDANRSEDSTVAFYRPFADILQDIHDEQNYLGRANWVYDIPPEHIPYLGFLLGWDLPYFPASIDAMRRSTLRNMVRLQRLKGTKRAIRELFDLFGFAINISNVWWTPDGKGFVAPGEQTARQEIPVIKTLTTEPLLLDYTENGFATTTVPLIHRPRDRRATIRAYVVSRGSAAHQYLYDLGMQSQDTVDVFDTPTGIDYQEIPSVVSDVESMEGLLGGTTAIIGPNGYIDTLNKIGDGPIDMRGLSVNYITNVLNLSLGRYFEFDADQTVLYVFASYCYDKIEIPEAMKDLHSNRFDIAITRKDDEQVDPGVVLFLIDFLYRIKAFHSLLRKVMLTILASDTYEVTDFNVGGMIQQDITLDAGKQQTPPNAIIPTIPTGGCFAYKPEDYGFRRWDIAYRERILADLAAEFEAWRLPSRAERASGSTECLGNHRGQDRIDAAETRAQQTTINNAIVASDDADRGTLCTLDGRNYCYPGRVRDKASHRQDLVTSDSWRFRPCSLGLGQGTYYVMDNRTGLRQSLASSLGYDGPSRHPNMLNNLYRAYGRPRTDALYYSADAGLSPDLNRHLAIRRPQLDIQKDNLALPGHRQPTLGALEDDYTHPTWKAKPWDYPPVCDRGEVNYDNSLSARLVDGETGQTLVFDDIPYGLPGNGMLPDISSLGDHQITGTSLSSYDEITHSVYGDATGHPAITLECTTQRTSTTVAVAKAMFNSAVSCGTGHIDLQDGYPAVVGILNDIYVPIDYFPSLDSEVSDQLAHEWMIPDSPGTWAGTIAFTLSSEIRVSESSYEYDLYRPNRLDCGCLLASCGSDDYILTCTTEQFIGRYGNFDNDQVEVEKTMIMGEAMAVGAKSLDLRASTLFGINGGNPWPDTGTFTYKDGYGTIYDVYWETIGNYLDVVTVTSEPRVWGQSWNAGRLINKEIHNDGVITTMRQVLLRGPAGWNVIAAGEEQEIGEFKSTYLCNSPFSDPFVDHLGSGIQDNIELIIGT